MATELPLAANVQCCAVNQPSKSVIVCVIGCQGPLELHADFNGRASVKRSPESVCVRVKDGHRAAACC